MSYPTWNAGTYYLPSQTVSYLAVTYTSTSLQPNRGNIPPSSGTYWTAQNSGGSTTVSQTTGVTVTGNTSAGYTVGTNIVAGTGIGIVNTSGTQLTINNTGVSDVSTTLNSVNTNIGASLNVLGNGTSQLVLKNLGVCAVNSGTGVTATTTSNVNGGLLVALANTGVLSNVAGSGISVSGATGAVTIGNTGVLSNVAGTGISVSGATGTSTISNTGVLSVATGSGISTSGSTGAITLANTGVLSNLAGTGISVSGGTGNVTIANTGLLSCASTGTGISTTTVSGALTVNNTGVVSLAPNIGTGIGVNNTGTSYYLYNNMNTGTGIGITPSSSDSSITIRNTGVTSLVAGSNITLSPTNGLGAVTVNATVPSVPVNSVNGTGAGITVLPSTGDIYVSNTGVTSLVAGANVTLSGSTGAVTISSVSSSYTAGSGITISGGGVIANSGVLSIVNTDGLIKITPTPTGNIVISNQNPTGQLYCPVIRTTPWATAIGSYASGSRTDVMTSSAISTKQLWSLPQFLSGGVYTIPMNTSACGLLLPGNLTYGGGYTFGRTLFGCSVNGGTWMNTYNLGVSITVSATTYPDGSKGTIFGPITLTAQASVNEYGIVVNGSSIPSFLTVPVTNASSLSTGSLGGYGYCVLTITYNWYNMNSDPGGNISYGGTPGDFGVTNVIDRALVSGGTFTLY